MSKFRIAEMIEQDISDLESIVAYKETGLTYESAKRISQGIFKNLRDHIEELING